MTKTGALLLELPEMLHEDDLLLDPASEEGDVGEEGEEHGQGPRAGLLEARHQLQEVESLPGEVAGDAEEVVEEDISLEEVNEAASAADEETTSEEDFIGEVEAGEGCVADETFEDALNVVVIQENTEAVEVGADDTDMVDDCGGGNLLVHEELDDILADVHGGEVDEDLDVGGVPVGVDEVDVLPPEGGEDDVADGHEDAELGEVTEEGGLFSVVEAGVGGAAEEEGVEDGEEAEVEGQEDEEEGEGGEGVEQVEQEVIHPGGGGGGRGEDGGAGLSGWGAVSGV